MSRLRPQPILGTGGEAVMIVTIIRDDEGGQYNWWVADGPYTLYKGITVTMDKAFAEAKKAYKEVT